MVYHKTRDTCVSTHSVNFGNGSASKVRSPKTLPFFFRLSGQFYGDVSGVLPSITKDYMTCCTQ